MDAFDFMNLWLRHVKRLRDDDKVSERVHGRTKSPGASPPWTGSPAAPRTEPRRTWPWTSSTQAGHLTPRDTLRAPMSFVLVVEDDADIRDMMMYLLQTHGIASRSAGNGGDCPGRSASSPAALSDLAGLDDACDGRVGVSATPTGGRHHPGRGHLRAVAEPLSRSAASRYHP
jgi:hypothetical protein